MQYELTGDMVGGGSSTINTTITGLKGQPLPESMTQGGLFYTGSAWAFKPIPYDIAGYFMGKPAANNKIFYIPAVRAFTLPINLTGSLAKSDVAATASTVYSIRKNGVQFGTLTFANGSTVGTFAAASLTSFAIGDILSIVAPGTVDATHADIGFNLVASY